MTEAIAALLNAATVRAAKREIRSHVAIADSTAPIVGFFSFEGAHRGYRPPLATRLSAP